MEKRIAVVTGGNKGIGFEICKQLAAQNVKVILTARDDSRGEKAVSTLKESGLTDVVFHQLDVTDQSTIDSLANFVRVQFGKLDILVNNAGILGLSANSDALKSTKPEHDEEAQNVNDLPGWMRPFIEQTYELALDCLKTNYYGTKAVTEALIPLLESSNSGRIVNVSSILGRLRVIPNEELRRELSDVEQLTVERIDELANMFLKDFRDGLLEDHGWPKAPSAYRVSKALTNAYSRILAKKYSNLCINCVCPGYVKTDLNWNLGFISVEEGAKGPVILALGATGNPTGLFFDRTELSTF